MSNAERRPEINRPRIIALCFLLISNIGERAIAEESLLFEAEVKKQKVLCISNGGCAQEIVLTHKGRRIVITNNKKPWVENGEVVKLIKITSRTVIPRSKALGYVHENTRYVLYRDHETHNKANH